MSNPNIWIDVNSGTWGDSDNIVFVYADGDEIEQLDSMTDTEIIQFAIEKNAMEVQG